MNDSDDDGNDKNKITMVKMVRLLMLCDGFDGGLVTMMMLVPMVMNDYGCGRVWATGDWVVQLDYPAEMMANNENGSNEMKIFPVKI